MIIFKQTKSLSDFYFLSLSDAETSFHIKPEEDAVGATGGDDASDSDGGSSALFLHAFASGSLSAVAGTSDPSFSGGGSGSSPLAEAAILLASCNRLESELEKVGLASGSIL
jgi:hypothetical protein